MPSGRLTNNECACESPTMATVRGSTGNVVVVVVVDVAVVVGDVAVVSASRWCRRCSGSRRRRRVGLLGASGVVGTDLG